jgi:hypothetical protein
MTDSDKLLIKCVRDKKFQTSIIVCLVILIVVTISLTILTINRENEMGKKYTQVSSTEYFTIPNFLTEENFTKVKDSLKSASFTRKSTPMRSGEAISSMNLPIEVSEIIRSGSVLTRLKDETSLSLSFTPRTDENSISALRYSEPNDGIDSHYDGNVYIGSRWVGLLVLEDDGDSKLVLDGKVLKTMSPNTLILFQGDKIKHQVTRRATDGKRVMLNILFCDVCGLKTDIVSKIWSTVISNFAFY